MMITGDYHHTAIAVARDVGMVSPSAEMVIIDIPRQSPSQQHPNAPSPEGIGVQGRLGVGGQGWAGQRPEAPEEEGEQHTLEGQLSMAQTLLGHHPSWGRSSGDEDESPEQKHGNAPTGGASPKQPAGRSAAAWGQLAPPTEATPEAVPSLRLSHRHFILKPSFVLPTERYHKKVVLPPLTVIPVSQLSAPSDHPEVSQPASPSLDGAPLLTPACQGVLTPPDGTQPPFPGDSSMPSCGHNSEISQTVGDHQEVQQTTDDHQEVQQTIAPALRPAGHDHRLPPLLIPISHPHQSPASSTPISHHRQDPPITHGSWSRPGVQLPPSPLHHQDHQDHQIQDEDHRGLSPASPSQQPMQGEALSSGSQQIPRLRFSRHSSLCMNPFLGLFTPTGFGCPPPGGAGFDPTPTPRAAPKPGLAGLRFLQVQGNQDCEGSWALSALAEGQLQCAVTGDALEHMLQLRDTSLLEAVVRSAVVFARMKPHQKGQVMDLIGSAGLHQLLEGQHRHIKVGTARVCCCLTLPMFCLA